MTIWITSYNEFWKILHLECWQYPDVQCATIILLLVAKLVGEIGPQSRFPILNPAKQGKVRLQMAAFSVAGLHEYCFPHSENGL
jgi:hypothetical protein